MAILSGAFGLKTTVTYNKPVHVVSEAATQPQSFEGQCVTAFPALADVPKLEDDEWGALEVNAERLRSESSSEEWVQEKVDTFPRQLLRVLCLWLELNHNQLRGTLVEDLVEHICGDPSDDARLTVLLIAEFTRGKREGAIEQIARHTLPEVDFERLESAELPRKARKYLMVLSLFFERKERLRTLMLYNRAERAGYVRHGLHPNGELKETDDNEAEGEEANEYERVRAVIEDANIEGDITTDLIDKALEAYEDEEGDRASRCFDVFEDVSGRGDSLIFLLRSKGEEHIRQVDGHLFTERADFFVLRLMDDLRVIDMHPRVRWDTALTASIAGHLLGEPDVQYVQQRRETPKTKIEEFLKTLRKDEDECLRLYEIDLKNAPLEGSPQLMLRGEKEKSLSGAVKNLRDSDIKVFEGINDIKLVGVAFETDFGTEGAYIFKFYVQRDDGAYFLPYSDAVKASAACRDFENYLYDNYDVNVFPGDSKR